MAFRTVAKGDTFFTKVIPNGDKFDVGIYRENKGTFEDVPLKDGRVRRPSVPQAIWFHTGFVSEEVARNAAISQSLSLGLGTDIEDRSEKDDDGRTTDDR